jgi:hypothetical protein
MTIEQAYKKYHANYDNALYRAATDDKSTEYANQLIDTAMVYCGHPFFSIETVKTYWNETAKAFLAKFQ